MSPALIFFFHIRVICDRIIMCEKREGLAPANYMKTRKGVMQLMEKEEIRQELSALISDEMPELGDIDFTKDIVSEYGINSVSIIRLIVAAEARFDIKFTDYELSLESYKNFGDLVAVIKSKLDHVEI